jgi:hypothetical protein
MAKPIKPAPSPFALVGALLPLVYFGGMIYYFSGVGGGTIQGIVDIGLGPTVAGLTIVGLLFTIKPVMIIFRLLVGTPTAARSVSSDFDAVPESSFDADDAIARYMAKRGQGDAEAQPSQMPVDAYSAPAPRGGFGRKPI